jgi:hypothetical protein
MYGKERRGGAGTLFESNICLGLQASFFSEPWKRMKSELLEKSGWVQGCLID